MSAGTVWWVAMAAVVFLAVCQLILSALAVTAENGWPSDEELKSKSPMQAALDAKPAAAATRAGAGVRWLLGPMAVVLVVAAVAAGVQHWAYRSTMAGVMAVWLSVLSVGDVVRWVRMRRATSGEAAES